MYFDEFTKDIYKFYKKNIISVILKALITMKSFVYKDFNFVAI